MAKPIRKWVPGLANGHSICNRCGKEMPVCWDVVCHSCHHTFCYNCARQVQGQWLCLDCLPRWAKTLDH